MGNSSTRQDEIFGFLHQEGILPRLGAEGDIIFKLDETTFQLNLFADDEHLYQFCATGFWSIKDKASTVLVSEAVSKIRAKENGVEILLDSNGKEIMATLESSCQSVDDFLLVFKSLRASLIKAGDDFCAEMRRLESESSLNAKPVVSKGFISTDLAYDKARQKISKASFELTIISDTHSQHEKLNHLQGDVLIHCGDMLDLYYKHDSDIERLDEWYGQLDFDLILCTGGNHDHLLEKTVQQTPCPFKNAVFLQDQAYLYEGVVFYGAPWVHKLFGLAFYRNPQELEKKWAKIPAQTDVLITHTPPFSILDDSGGGLHLGCELLAAELQRISPKIHCFGHVHNSAGMLKMNGTTFINGALYKSSAELTRQPIVVTVKTSQDQHPRVKAVGAR